MTDRMFDLTRRKILAGVGAVGVAGAGAGLGTSALFSDTESVEDNTITAGQLNLVVDFFTSRDQGQAGTDSQSGEVDGNGATVYTYDVTDVKPGDSGTLAFCPKVVDNPGYVWVGSEEGATDYENGQTEPESEGDATGGGTLGGSNDGAGAGELSELIEVTVSYAESITYNAGNDEVVCNNTRELNNPDGYSLADLAKDLESGFQLDGNEPNDGDGYIDAYPGSSGPDDQQGPCLCIEWELPVEVGNEVQSDAVRLPLQFTAFQERNNPNPANPFVDVTVGPSSGSTSYDFNSIQAAVDAASSGDVITVDPKQSGSYTEPNDVVDVDENNVFLASTAGKGSVSFDGRMIASADGVTICGFKVTPPAAPSNSKSEAIRVSNSPDGVTIRDNVVEDFSRAGTSGFYGVDGINVFGGSSSDPIENVTIANNTVRNLRNNISGGAAGISIQGNVDGATVIDNTVTEIGKQVTSYGFGVTIRGTGNHSVVPANVNVVDNDISEVLADPGTQYLGVGLGVESGGTDYLFRDNTVSDINIGVELKAASTQTTLTSNSISSIDTSVNGSPALYLGDQTGSAPIASIIGDNTFDQQVTSGGSVGPYVQTIVPV
jgi:predicted ribosomally synthesized peptide with SipW-like signal peptide